MSRTFFKKNIKHPSAKAEGFKSDRINRRLKEYSSKGGGFGPSANRHSGGLKSHLLEINRIFTTAKVIKERIIEAAQQHYAGCPYADDVTLIVGRVQ